ncbi:MAG: hypothetical protein ACJAQ6_000591 [Arenicella sp.]|jgi:hypothetical protein
MKSAAVVVDPADDSGEEVCELNAVVPKSQITFKRVAAVSFFVKIAAPIPHCENAFSILVASCEDTEVVPRAPWLKKKPIATLKEKRSNSKKTVVSVIKKHRKH